MREQQNGIEVQAINGERVGTIFFDQGNLYFASGTLPINIKNVNEGNIEILSSFFKRHYNYPTQSTIRLDIDNPNGVFSIRLVDKILYISQNKHQLIWQNIGLSEFKKVGIWLNKQRKIQE